MHNSISHPENIKMTVKINLILLFISLFVVSLNATNYEVGPGKQYTSILEIATHTLEAGDSIKVYYKSEPYYEKFLLHGIGTADNPIVLLGIADENGNKPILDGTNALSNTASSYWNEDRQLILIGQANSVQSDYIIVDGFEIREANDLNTYTDDQGVANQTYLTNASGIRISWGQHITIRNCTIYNNGNGIQSGNKDDQHITIEYCDIYNNGKSTSYSAFIHNLYMSTGDNSEVIIQYCHIGELLSNGQQVKSRAQTTVIRYNWIEGGRNSCLDLVENTNHSEEYTADAYVYGNVIIKADDSENARIIHFGVDNSGHFRLGTCYFYNNTCIIKDTRISGNRRVFQMTDEVASIVADNNIFYKPDAATYELMAGTSNLSGSNNWFSDNIMGINILDNSLSGANPNFVDPASEDYHLQTTSPCYDVVNAYNYPADYDLTEQYVKHLNSIPRPINGNIDLGAFEIDSPVAISTMITTDFKAFPNPTTGILKIDNVDIEKVLIFDSIGKFVKEVKPLPQIDLSELNSGIYFLKIETNTKTRIHRIVKL